jgi:hypothetical protein
MEGTKMARRQPAPELEELGPRTLPSVTSLAPTADLLTAPHQPTDVIHIPVDRAHGGYSTDPVQSGAGAQYHFQGAGHLAGMGDVEVGGNLSGVGFIEHGHAHGTLTFHNVWGSITIELTGPVQPAFSSLPVQYSYHVVSRTGAGNEVPLPDHGTLHLVLTPAPTAHGAPLRGTFALTF